MKTRRMNKAEEIMRRIRIHFWLGHSVQEIEEDLEKEYQKPLNSAMRGLIEEMHAEGVQK